MLDHILFAVSDYEKAKQFYSKILAPMDAKIIMEIQGSCGFGVDGKPYLWIYQNKKTSPHLHIAFSAKNRKIVDQFYKIAIQEGAKDNGEPGIREHYHPNYYGAFILDFDGHNIEAVCHLP